MADEFLLLSQEERDEMLAATLLAQERDLFMHKANKERFGRILANGARGEFRKRIEDLYNQTEDRISEVTQIIEALKPELPPVARLKAAAERIKAREEAARGGVTPAGGAQAGGGATRGGGAPTG
jgi:hypothetical protein